jgi:signal transduction histidine kinase
MLSTLDSTAAIKASQALSGEIKLDRLLNKLLKIVLESAGADKCVILMPQQQEWFVEAVATIDEPVQVESVPLSSRTDLPHRLIRTVRQSLQSSLIFDTLNHPTLIDDVYITQTCPKSILCTPILHQGNLVAILYLENRITIGAFTHDRIELLNLLLSQAAISLENAKLYSQVKHSTLQLQNLADNIPGVIYQFQIDAQGKASFPFMSVGSRKLFEIEPEMIQQEADLIIQLIEPESLVEFQVAVQNSMQLMQPFNWDSQFSLPSGEQKWIEARSIPTKQTDGSTIWDGVMLNVSEQKTAATTILQKSQALEQALDDLQSAQLQTVQSEKMASLGNLVAGVAHEINNPIGFLNGSINNAKDYVSDLIEHIALYQQHHPNPAGAIQDNAEEIDLEFLREDLPKLLNSMGGATDRIKGISTSLRTFSRADTEHKVSADLHEGLDSTLLILKYRLKANEIRPAIEIVQNYGNLKSIDCFPGQLNQVFMNLLANAIDVFDEAAQQSSFAALQASPQCLTITTAQVGQSVEIRIQDNGKGMDEATQARIFDHLFTTKEVGKGTGLGLAIARQIVEEKHGGRLEVQSKLGSGTVFLIVLPT